MEPVSIIIPTLNEERYLPTLLASLQACTARMTLEVIVVDGHSDDKTCAVVEQYAEQFHAPSSLRVIHCDQRNVAVQRNMGAHHAHHETIMFLDADTVIPSPQRLETILNRFYTKGYGVATCRFVSREGDLRTNIYYTTLFCFHKFMERISPYGLGACLITTKTMFEQCKGFDPNIRINEDANFCLRASKYKKFCVILTALAVSNRRFVQYGFLRMGFRYLRIFLSRTLFGELRDDSIDYPFGKYDV